MIQKLIEKIQKTKAPICVGLDPMLNYIPEHILKKSFGEFGETLGDRRPHLGPDSVCEAADRHV